MYFEQKQNVQSDADRILLVPTSDKSTSMLSKLHSVFNTDEAGWPSG